MKIYPAGSLTFVISENHSKDEEMSDEMTYKLAESLSDYFTFQLTKHHLDKIVAVTGLRVYRGCVTIVITVGMVAAAGGGVLLIELLKNYKDVREGINMILKDMKNLKIWVKKAILKKKNIETAQKAEPFEIMFQQAIDQYNSVPPELRKFWSAGQEITVMNNQGEYCKYTMAIKREDIKPPEETPALEENKNKPAAN